MELWRGAMAMGLVLAVACGTSEKSAGKGAAVPRQMPPSAPSAGAAVSAPTSAKASLAVRWERRLEGPVLVVENRGDVSVDLSTDVALGGGGHLSLRDDCHGTVPTCRPLAPGAALTPPPWNGAQCGTQRPFAGPLPTATVRTCDGGTSAETAEN